MYSVYENLGEHQNPCMELAQNVCVCAGVCSYNEFCAILMLYIQHIQPLFKNPLNISILKEWKLGYQPMKSGT